jgi:hypothetical protein
MNIKFQNISQMPYLELTCRQFHTEFLCLRAAMPSSSGLLVKAIKWTAKCRHVTAMFYILQNGYLNVSCISWKIYYHVGPYSKCNSQLTSLYGCHVSIIDGMKLKSIKVRWHNVCIKFLENLWIGLRVMWEDMDMIHVPVFPYKMREA